MALLFISAILVESIIGNIFDKLFWIQTNVQMWFKDISYLELWQPLCSADWNQLRVNSCLEYKWANDPCPIHLRASQDFSGPFESVMGYLEKVMDPRNFYIKLSVK